MITRSEVRAISHASAGLSGADLEAVVKRARGRARRAKRTIETADLHAELDAALDKGNGAFSERALEVLSFHAGARAIVTYVVDAGTVRYINLGPSGLRMRMDDPVEADGSMDTLAMDELHAERLMTSLLAGRASEALLGRSTLTYATISASGLSDLDAATWLAMNLELATGSSERGPIGYGGVTFELLLRVPGLQERVAARIGRAGKDADRLVRTFEPQVREAARLIRTEPLVDGPRIKALLD